MKKVVAILFTGISVVAGQEKTASFGFPTSVDLNSYALMPSLTKLKSWDD